jgi:hypothetical protein
MKDGIQTVLNKPVDIGLLLCRIQLALQSANLCLGSFQIARS